MIEYIIFLTAAYFAAIFATVAGFGSSTLLVPVAILFFDFKTGIVLVACFHLFNNLFKVKYFSPSINFRIFITFGIPSIIFAFIGARIFSSVPSQNLQQFLGIFLVLFSLASLRNSNLRFQSNTSNALLGGSMSGFLAGLIGLGGAIRSMFLVSFGMDKEAYVATAALIALVVDFTRIPTYIFVGPELDKSMFLLIPFMIVIAFLGVKTGKGIVTKIDARQSRQLILWALLIVGIIILLTAK